MPAIRGLFIAGVAGLADGLVAAFTASCLLSIAVLLYVVLLTCVIPFEPENDPDSDVL